MQLANVTAYKAQLTQQNQVCSVAYATRYEKPMNRLAARSTNGKCGRKYRL